MQYEDLSTITKEEEVNSLEVDIQRLKKKSTQRLYTIRGVIRETQKQIMKINKKI